MVAEKLERDADAIRAEGWKWVETALEFAYGHSYGLRRIAGARPVLSDEEIAKVEALRAEAERIEEEAATPDEISDEADARLVEIEAEIEAIHQRPAIYDPADIALAGAFVSIDGNGRLRVERGYVRPEDEPPAVDAAGDASDVGAGDEAPGNHRPAEGDSDDPGTADGRIIVAHVSDDTEPEEEEGIGPCRIVC